VIKQTKADQAREKMIEKLTEPETYKQNEQARLQREADSIAAFKARRADRLKASAARRKA